MEQTAVMKKIIAETFNKSVNQPNAQAKLLEMWKAINVTNNLFNKMNKSYYNLFTEKLYTKSLLT